MIRVELADDADAGEPLVREFPDPYQAVEWLAEHCSVAELHHFRLWALPQVLRRVGIEEAKARRAAAGLGA